MRIKVTVTHELELKPENYLNGDDPYMVETTIIADIGYQDWLQMADPDSIAKVEITKVAE